MSEESCQSECDNPNCQRALLLSRKAENKYQLRLYTTTILLLLPLGVFTLNFILTYASGFEKAFALSVLFLQIGTIVLSLILDGGSLIERDHIKAQLEHLEWTRAAMPTT